MSQEAPADEYRRACDRFFEVQAINDWQMRAAEMKSLQQWWEAIVGKLKQVEESEDPKVWYALGDAHQHGRGVARDRPAAIAMFRRAAEAGHGRAMVRLGGFFNHPERPEEWATAIHWFRKAAEQGEAAGMVSLGLAYKNGRGVPVDPGEAVNWFLKAVSVGDGLALMHAGRIYWGSLQAPAEAAKCFLRAAEAGLTESHIALADLYADEESSGYNPTEAAKWYQKVAEGSGGSRGRALLELSRYACRGIGRARNIAEARDWLAKLLEIVPQKSELRTAARRLLKECTRIELRAGNDLWPGLGVSWEDLEEKAVWLARDDPRLPGTLGMYFRTAGSLLRQSRCDFSLLPLALFQAIVGLEKVLKKRYGDEEAKLKELLEWAAAEGTIHDKLFSKIEPLPKEFQRRIENQNGPYSRQFVELVRALRNEFSHGTYTLHPFQLTLALQVREAVNGILQ